MSQSDAEKWNSRYREGKHDSSAPVEVLARFAHLLPVKGTALDLACGTGANALLLAEKGLDTSAWDISPVALEYLSARAAEKALEIHTQTRDVVSSPPEAASFNVIVVSYFLERGLFPCIIDALKPEGLLYYQTFIRDKRDDTGPVNPEFRLERNELLDFCNSLHLIYYHEEGITGNLKHGFRNEAMLIGQRV